MEVCTVCPKLKLRIGRFQSAVQRSEVQRWRYEDYGAPLIQKIKKISGEDWTGWERKVLMWRGVPLSLETEYFDIFSLSDPAWPE